MAGTPISTGSAALRSELSHRNRARSAELQAELSCSEVPSVVYSATEDGGHGNFLLPAYRRILCHPEWKARLAKPYTCSRFFARAKERARRELDCANSSDALLMNIFCYPGVTRRSAVCALLGIERGLQPRFGYKPGLLLKSGARDRTEIDLRLGELFVEAKLTENDFQTARCDAIERYRDHEKVFDLPRLPLQRQKLRSWQLIRGILAAHEHQASFAVFCDGRRQDLIEDCFQILSAVSDSDLRCRISVVTWQELASTMPHKLRIFLDQKYGIAS